MKTLEELEQEYKEALEEKDKIIEALREENKLLLKMSLRNAHERVKINEHIKKHSR